MPRRATIVFAIAVVAIVAAVVVAYVVVFEGEPAPVVVAPATARLVQADGVVELKVGGGDWQPVPVGTLVEQASVVRTAAGANAELAVGEGVKLQVLPDTDVRIESLDGASATLLVESGIVVADVDGARQGSVKVRAAGSDAVAQIRDGRLHFATDGRGEVQAAVTRGEGTLSAAGSTVTLTPGSQSVVHPGGQPSAPAPLPRSFLLKVKWPPEALTAKRRQMVRGNTTPGARVRIGGVVVTADADGHFGAVVELVEGPQKIKVYAVDLLGRQATDSSPAIELDTRAPGHAVETDATMWQRH
ncbi:MAG: hypothetical protein AAB426_10365 [Myxococcota bacterium]